MTLKKIKEKISYFAEFFCALQELPINFKYTSYNDYLEKYQF